MPHGALPPLAHATSSHSLQHALEHSSEHPPGHLPGHPLGGSLDGSRERLLPHVPHAPHDSRAPSHGELGHAARRHVAGAVEIHVADYARTTLKARHRPVLRALAEALFDHEPAIPPARLDGFAEEVDRFVSPASKTLRFGLLLMLDVIRILPLFVIGRWAMFEDVPLEGRIEMLRRLERSKVAPLTLVLIAYKTILTLLFFENERELMATGYTGPNRVRWQKKGLPMITDARATEPVHTHDGAE